MSVFENREPQSVLHWFEEISAVPRGSLREEKIAAFVMDFARERGLFCREDTSHNVLVRMPATADRQGSAPLILQSHMDMVCACEEGVSHDFRREGLDLYLEGERIRARGTTLGADNGIGVAYQLAILDGADGVSHPPIEAIFTTAEEIGMLGAMAFDASQLQGRRMINFDAGGFTEGRIYVGCAGNQHAQLRQKLRYTAAEGGTALKISLSGLLGGHSGGDIHLGRGNGSVILGRLMGLLLERGDVGVAAFGSGDPDQENKNGITDRACLSVLCQAPEELRAVLEDFQTMLRDELRDVDEGVTLSVEPLAERLSRVLSTETAALAADLLQMLPNGVQSMQRAFPDTPECSCNIGNVETDGENVIYYLSIRSCKESLIDQVCARYRAVARRTGTELTLGRRLPGWDYDPASPLRQIVEDEFRRSYPIEPRFKVTHASTECALFKRTLPKLDIISMGPIIYEEHTPREWMGLESVGVLWEFVKRLLAQL